MLNFGLNCLWRAPANRSSIWNYSLTGPAQKVLRKRRKVGRNPLPTPSLTTYFSSPSDEYSLIYSAKTTFSKKQENWRISSTKNCNRRIFVRIFTLRNRCNTSWKLPFYVSLTTHFSSPSDGYSLMYSTKTIISSTKQENRRISSTKNCNKRVFTKICSIWKR